MKILATIFLFCGIFYACSKPSTSTTTPPPPPPPPPVVITDAHFQISNTIKTEINEFNIIYVTNPPAGETFSNLFLIWSTNQDFSTGKDSAVIGITGGAGITYHLAGLKSATRYYGKIGLNYKGSRYYSLPKEWLTDSLKILGAGNFGLARGLNRFDTTIIVTNLQPVSPMTGTSTKVFVGAYECPVASDQARTISFSVPGNIPAGKYSFKLVTRGMEVIAVDSTQVLRGRWTEINSPVIPGNPAASTTGLVFFNTAYSPQKGYMIGGEYFNGPPVPWPYSMYPEYVMEFDGPSLTWTKRVLTNPRFFEDPIFFYYNNSVYMIGGYERQIDQFGNDHAVILKKILRLDLGSLTWYVMNDVPYPSIFNLTGFELNNEFYIGMGADADNRSLCCGVPLPSKKFWKYNPASNQWTQLADFPGGHQNYPTSFSIGNKGYAFYGAIPIGDPVIATNFTKELWEYNPGSNSWNNIPLPASGGPPPGEKYQITSYNGKAYFLSCQRRELSGLGYDFSGYSPCLEWDPATNIFKEISFPQNGGNILKTIFKNGNTFYYQTDALGYFTSLPNKTYSFAIEQ